MLSRIGLLISIAAASIAAAACDKPTSASPPASPQVRPHDQSPDNLVALLMALRKEKTERPPHGASEPDHSADAERTKSLPDPASEKFEKAG